MGVQEGFGCVKARKSCACMNIFLERVIKVGLDGEDCVAGNCMEIDFGAPTVSVCLWCLELYIMTIWPNFYV